MNRLYVVESSPSITGSMADTGSRSPVRKVEGVARGSLNFHIEWNRNTNRPTTSRCGSMQRLRTCRLLAANRS